MLFSSSNKFLGVPYHPLLSANPLHNVSVLTILSINFFHNIPSEITRCHSLQTSSAEHNDLASRYDKMFSAIWSKPLAERKEKYLTTSNVYVCIAMALSTYFRALLLLQQSKPSFLNMNSTLGRKNTTLVSCYPTYPKHFMAILVQASLNSRIVFP